MIWGYPYFRTPPSVGWRWWFQLILSLQWLGGKDFLGRGAHSPLRMGSQEATNEVPNHTIVTLFGDFKGYPWKLDAGREPRSVGSAVTYSSGVEGYIGI